MAGGSASQDDRIKRIKATDLTITWGDDPRYWKKNEDGSAELLEMCWLEVRHSVEAKKGFEYLVKFKLSLNKDKDKDKDKGEGEDEGENEDEEVEDKENSCWENVPVFIMAKIGQNGEDQLSEPIELLALGLDKEPKEIPLGDEEFKIGPISKDDTLYFGLYEVWEGNWKSGLIVHEAIVEKLPLPRDDSGSTSK